MAKQQLPHYVKRLPVRSVQLTRKTFYPIIYFIYRFKRVSRYQTYYLSCYMMCSLLKSCMLTIYRFPRVTMKTNTTMLSKIALTAFFWFCITRKACSIHAEEALCYWKCNLTVLVYGISAKRENVLKTLFHQYLSTSTPSTHRLWLPLHRA